jgi:S-(hydroxymethyl)glutathione dehydrogenase/alcohol dehydrogenase
MMKAAVLRAAHEPLAVEEVLIDAPRPREVLVRTAASGVCHSDYHFVTGDLEAPMPIILGHESAGVVEEVGRDVTHVQPGDHVVTCLSAFCGTCSFCLSGRPALCTKQGIDRAAGQPPRLSQDGTVVHQLGISSFAEKSLLHENALVKIDERMPLDVASLISCGVLTGLGSVFRTAKVRPGDTVAVVGCGGVGLACIQGAAIAGAARIVAVDTVAAKADLATRLGATDFVDATAGDAAAAVRDLTGGGVDYAFEAVGRPATFELAMMTTRPGGTTTMIGLMSPTAQFRLPHGALSLERRIQGCALGSNRFRMDIPHYVDLYLRGRLDLDAMVTSRIALEDVNDAFDRMSRGEGARSVITFA